MNDIMDMFPELIGWLPTSPFNFQYLITAGLFFLAGYCVVTVGHHFISFVRGR